MTSLLAASIQAGRSLFAPGMLSIFIKSIVITLIALTGFVILVTMLTGWLTEFMQWPAGTVLPWFTGVGAALIAGALFPGIMPIIVNFFDDDIAAIIERRDYPHARPSPQPFLPELIHDARFSAMAIGLNALVLPAYLIFWPLAFIIFYWLNGYLLGREFFVMVARRYMPIEEAHRLRLEYKRTITWGGIGLTVLATIPWLNLLAPFWGIAVMIHLFHSLPAERKTPDILPPA